MIQLPGVVAGRVTINEQGDGRESVTLSQAFVGKDYIAAWFASPCVGIATTRLICRGRLMPSR
jgi:hypothetical protein